MLKVTKCFAVFLDLKQFVKCEMELNSMITNQNGGYVLSFEHVGFQKDENRHRKTQNNPDVKSPVFRRVKT